MNELLISKFRINDRVNITGFRINSSSSNDSGNNVLYCLNLNVEKIHINSLTLNNNQVKFNTNTEYM